MSAAASVPRNRDLAPNDFASWLAKLNQLDAIDALPTDQDGTRSLDLARALGMVFDRLVTDGRGALARGLAERILRDGTPAVRRKLADGLAQAQTAPAELLVALAEDAAPVAEPVLLRAAGLPLNTQLGLIERGYEGHSRLLARRRPMTEPLCAALIEGGSAATLRALLQAHGEHLRAADLRRMAERHGDTSGLFKALYGRRDLDFASVLGLAEVFAERLGSAALRGGSLDDALVTAINQIDDEADDPAVHPPVDLERQVAPEVMARAQAGRIDDVEAFSALLAGDVALFTIVLAARAGIAPARAHYLLHGVDVRGIASLAHGAALGAPQFLLLRALQVLARSARSDARPQPDLWRASLERINTQYQRSRQRPYVIAAYLGTALPRVAA